MIEPSFFHFIILVKSVVYISAQLNNFPSFASKILQYNQIKHIAVQLVSGFTWKRLISLNLNVSFRQSGERGSESYEHIYGQKASLLNIQSCEIIMEVERKVTACSYGSKKRASLLTVLELFAEMHSFLSPVQNLLSVHVSRIVGLLSEISQGRSRVRGKKISLYEQLHPQVFIWR